MSDPKLISPLLDGFAMGAPMSGHDGVRCCPAVKENSDNKYIVKVISVPASQKQLDALLLTGAYKDPAAAMDYFKELADGIVQEAETLQKLSRLEGFLPYESWQIVPMEENRLGYDVYLVTSYKRSLEKFMRRNPMTHLATVNLGLDMCAALAICRNAGYLYVDLQPSNIFISEDKEYRIGDLGFVSLSSLKYASLPTKYRSVYTPPELHDPMATLNTTMDIYAAGLILYQIYNNGVLPFVGKAPAEPLPAPLNADYEIAEIILKACDPEPSNRWQDPMEMGQALVSYMQRNVINDVPVGPPMGILTKPQEADAEATPDVGQEEATATDDAAIDTAEAEGPDENADLPPADSENGQWNIPDDSEDPPESMEPLVTGEDAPEETAEPSPDSEDSDLLPVDVDTDPESTDDNPEDDRKTMVIQPQSGTRKRKFVIFDDDDEDEDDYEDEGDEYEEDEPFDPQPKPKKKKTGLILALVLILLVGALIVGSVFFYQNYYLLEVRSIAVNAVDGAPNSLMVTIDTDVDNTLLTVVCSDSYGNNKRSAITNGQALFTDLTPDTMYQFQLEAQGFHQLKGPDYSSYTTAAKTDILSFTGVTGNEDGSVVLSFTVEGPEKEWSVVCSAEGEEDRTIPFTGHTVTVTGLTVGKTYTFALTDPSETLYMVGNTTLEFTASSIILAQDLEITACGGGSLTASWSAPEDAIVESWNVLCYGDDGFTTNTTTSETSITFDGIGTDSAYTVEVKAAGMTQAVRTTVTANPITITKVNVDESNPEKLTVSWEYEGNAPEGGWYVMYTLDNSDTQQVVSTDTNSAVISPRIPGAEYTFVFYARNSATIFNDTYVYGCPNAEAFAQYSMLAKNVTASTLVTPGSNWSYKNVSKKDYTSSFKAGQSISLLLHTDYSFYIPRENVSILYVIRDAEGNVLTDLMDYSTGHVWYELWFNPADYHYCELDLPKVPTEPGQYSLYLYFNGAALCKLDFSITE